MNQTIQFPPVELADESGLLAYGGDLSIERLLHAYRNGIFPWYNEGEPILWWSPDPRCVLFPEKIHISKSMKQVLRRGEFVFSMNRSFRDVILSCKTTERNAGPGSWLSDEMVSAYVDLHNAGHAMSAETYHEGNLVGGLYGVKIGKVFFGESMFSKTTNASKFALIKLTEYLKKIDVKLVDCQVHSDHLISLGAEMISRRRFSALLSQYTVV